MNVYDYFMNRSNVLKRVNQYVVAQSTVHNLCGKGMTDYQLHWRDEVLMLQLFLSVSADISNAIPEDIAATVASSLHYITSKQGNHGYGDFPHFSACSTMYKCFRRVYVEGGECLGCGGSRHWTGKTSRQKCYKLHCEFLAPPFSSLSSTLTRISLTSSLQLTSDLFQVALVHNPSDSASPSLLARAVQALLSHVSPTKASPLISSLLDVEDPSDQAAIFSLASEAGVEESKMEKLVSGEDVSKVIQDHVIFSRRVLEIEAGQTALVSNGKVRVIGQTPYH